MNKFVELSPELNFHANWHVSSSLVTFVFDSIYLCTLMSAFFISTGMSCISIACNWTLSDPFRELGSWFVELWVAGVGEVFMFLLTLLVAAIIIPMIRSTLTNSKAKHVLDFLNLKQEAVFCLSLEAIYSIFSSGNTPCSIKSLLCEVAGHGRIKIWSTIINNHPGISRYMCTILAKFLVTFFLVTNCVTVVIPFDVIHMAGKSITRVVEMGEGGWGVGFFTPKQGEVIQGSVINFPRSLLIQENQRRGEEKSPVDVVEHRPECLEWWFLSFRKISATSTSAELQNTAFFLRRCYLPFTLKQRNLGDYRVISQTEFYKNSKWSDCYVLEFLHWSAGGKHLMRFQSETSIFIFF